MHIGIDGNEANVNKRVGVSEYAFEISKRIATSKKHTTTIYLKKDPLPHMPKADGFKYKVFGPKPLWTQFALPASLMFSNENVFFSPTHYAPRFTKIPTVISIMDLAFIHFPEMFTSKDRNQLVSWTGYSVKNASKIITISQASKNDIITHYKLKNDKVKVVYPGIKDSYMAIQKKSTKEDYILFVSTLQPRKNIERLIEAFSQVTRDQDVKLKIVGKKGWKYEDILKAPDKFGVKDRVEFMDFVPDDELSTLYKNAKLFVMPSLYEGFGLPILEAMKHGTPVAASNVSSLPEAGGNAAAYFDPNDVSDMARVISCVLNSPKKQEEMIKKGLTQVKKFSWDKSAKEVLSVLESVK